MKYYVLSDLKDPRYKVVSSLISLPIHHCASNFFLALLPSIWTRTIGNGTWWLLRRNKTKKKRRDVREGWSHITDMNTIVFDGKTNCQETNEGWRNPYPHWDMFRTFRSVRLGWRKGLGEGGTGECTQVRPYDLVKEKTLCGERRWEHFTEGRTCLCEEMDLTFPFR